MEAARLQDSALYLHLLREVVMEPLHQLLSLRWEEETGTITEVNVGNRKKILESHVCFAGGHIWGHLGRVLRSST